MTDNRFEEVDLEVDTSSGSQKMVYADGDTVDNGSVYTRRMDSTDDVDPRGLYGDPKINEIRWYYRRTFADVIVDKPIDDAFKNGYELTTEDDDDNLDDLEDFLEEYEKEYKFAQKKARRDGFSLLYFNITDTASGPHVSPNDDGITVTDFNKFQTFTIDDLTSAHPKEIEEQTEYSREQIEVRDHGIVIVTDILDENYRDPIGYVVDGSDPQFLHADRCQHFVWNPTVDMDYKSDSLGRWEGNSILITSYNLLKNMAKGDWAIMQALFRNAAELHTVIMPEDATEKDLQEVQKNVRNLNAKSELILPFGYEVDAHGSEGNMEPREHYDILFDEICASHEMTRSVLFGTQSGTVSGSETDIKNYFNKVSRLQTNRIEEDHFEMLEMVKGFSWQRSKRRRNPLDGITVDDIEFDWNPLFKVSEADRVEMLRTDANSMQMLINGYVISPDEARSIMSERWAKFDLGNHTDTTKGLIEWADGRADRDGEEIEMEVGAAEEGEGAMENPREQASGSGMQSGQKTSSLADSDDVKYTIEL